MEQFTASEVRDRKRFEEWYATHSFNYSRDPIGSRDCSLQWEAWKAARADLLEVQERAVPVMVVNHVSSAEHDLPIGMKLYAHPSPSDAERLAEALRQIAREPRKPWPDPFGHSHEAFARAVHATWCDINRIARAALATHSAQAQPPAAHAQAQSGEWVMVPREPTKAMIEASCKIKLGRLEALRDGHGASSGVASAVREEWDAMLAAALQPQAVQPVAWVNPDNLHNPNFVGVNAVKVGHEGLGKHYTLPLYTHPQPEQDAALYQELLMAVSKKFPNESRHETALRYIRETELQSCEPKCDAAMAKESDHD